MAHQGKWGDLPLALLLSCATPNLFAQDQNAGITLRCVITSASQEFTLSEGVGAEVFLKIERGNFYTWRKGAWHWNSDGRLELASTEILQKVEQEVHGLPYLHQITVDRTNGRYSENEQVKPLWKKERSGTCAPSAAPQLPVTKF